MTRRRHRWLRKGVQPEATRATEATPAKALREFVYLDEVCVQSLLVSLVGNLPTDVTELTSRSNESEITGTVSASAPALAKAEVGSRFKGTSTTSTQVLSRAVAESLFKKLYELGSDRLVWSPSQEHDPKPISVQRGDLIEVQVELASDPIYGFNATMGVFSDIAHDYPTILDDQATALIIKEAGLVTRLLDRLLVGLIPVKAEVEGLAAGNVDGRIVAAPANYFEAEGIASSPLSIVGVTEHAKYWQDVRRVLFSKSKFTVLGRVARSGVQPSWTPVKLTELMRDIAPQFPEMITRVGQVGYAMPINTRQMRNQDALERALLHFAQAVAGRSAETRQDDLANFVRSLRDRADSLVEQTSAFEALTAWMVQSGIINTAPTDARKLRAEARAASGLQADSSVTSLADFASPTAAGNPEPEALIDLEVIAIYW